MVMGRHIKPLSKTSKKRVRNFFESIQEHEVNTQIEYWQKKAPKTEQEVKEQMGICIHKCSHVLG